MSFARIGGREIRITPFNRSMVRQWKSNLFVKNLGPTATNRSLYSMFAPFGEIFSSRLAQTAQGRSRGYGFVQYRVESDASRAIEALNGKSCGGSASLLVEFYRPPSATAFRTLYVKCLPRNVRTREDLDKLFAQFGERSSVALYQRDYKGTANYFGFVNFKSPESAAKACETMNGRLVDGTALYVSRATRKDQREHEKDNRRVRLRRLTLHVKSRSGNPLSEDLLKKELGKFGKVTQAVVRTQTCTGERLPIGFVVFAAESQVTKACAEYPDQERPLVISRLEGKEERAERLRQLRAGRSFDYSLSGYFSFYEQCCKMPSPPRTKVRNAFEGLSLPSAASAPRTAARRPAPILQSEEKERVGEVLYDRVERLADEYHAGDNCAQSRKKVAKVTGMLLELTREEVADMLRSEEALAAKVKEAEELLQDSAEDTTGSTC